MLGQEMMLLLRGQVLFQLPSGNKRRAPKRDVSSRRVYRCWQWLC